MKIFQVIKTAVWLIGLSLFFSCKGDNEGRDTKQGLVKSPVIKAKSIDTTVVKVQDTIVAPKVIVKESDWKYEVNRQELILAVTKAELEGLSSEDYFLKKIKKREKTFSKLDSIAKLEYYDLLTQSFNKYYKHLFYGKVAYKSINKDWDISRRRIKIDTMASFAIGSKTVGKVLKSAIPKHTHYQNLKKALAFFQQRIGKDGKDVDINDNLYLMSEHPEMITIKKKLRLWDDSSKIDTIRAEYNQSLMGPIKRFQAHHCIDANGIINYETVKALNVSMQKRKEQVIANLERWRWFPRNFGKEYLLINIPEYQLYYYRNGKVVRKHKIVVGKKERQTPVMTSKIDYIVLNPTWTVPETILKEDYIPEMIKDRQYLKNKGITIYKQDRVTEIKPDDWQESKAFSYKYIQGPNKDNVLGEVKFIFDNTHFVYLHDTNQRWYFDKVKRNLSSGCIRVEKPLDLAMDLSSKLMNHIAKNSGKEIEKVKKNFNTDLDTKIVILYYTAWGTQEGVRFRPDIYDLDTQIYKLLRK